MSDKVIVDEVNQGPTYWERTALPLTQDGKSHGLLRRLMRAQRHGGAVLSIRKRHVARGARNV